MNFKNSKRRYATVSSIIFVHPIIHISLQACERQPLFYTKYEDAWPIEVYMELYLYNRAATAGSRCRSANLNARSASEQLIPSVDRHESPSSTCISRPSNEAKLCQLGKATMDQLRMAMGFSRPEFKKLRVSHLHHTFTVFFVTDFVLE